MPLRLLHANIINDWPQNNDFVLISIQWMILLPVNSPKSHTHLFDATVLIHTFICHLTIIGPFIWSPICCNKMPRHHRFHLLCQKKTLVFLSLWKLIFFFLSVFVSNDFSKNAEFRAETNLNRNCFGAANQTKKPNRPF